MAKYRIIQVHGHPTPFVIEHRFLLIWRFVSAHDTYEAALAKLQEWEQWESPEKPTVLYTTDIDE